MYAAGLQESESVFCTVRHCLPFYVEFFVTHVSSGKNQTNKGFLH
jgi:hypothetical protein